MPICPESRQQGWLDLVARQPDVAQLLIVERAKSMLSLQDQDHAPALR
jgi:hypothetical protein